MTARAVAAQARMEVALTVRRGESVLLTLILPPALLVFFATVPLLPLGAHPVGTLLPGVVALSVLSTAMVGLAIATGFERQQGVLKLLGVSPLTRGGWLTAKLASVVAIEGVQLALLAAAALALGWRPDGARVLLVVPLVLLGTAAFAGLGLLMAGRLRAETTLAAANGLYVLLLLGGGLVIPAASLPGPIADVARLLPASALAETLGTALGTGGPLPGSALAVLVAWAVLTPALAARTFRWQQER